MSDSKTPRALVALIAMQLLGQWGEGGRVRAQEYVIEKNDLLSVAFWQQPALNTQVRVREDGFAELPLAGRVQAAGYTLPKFEQEVLRQLSYVDARITQVSIAIIEYGSQKVYINGQVMTPGKYNFATMPTIWQAILEAGGPMENANLSQITLVRGSGPEAGKVVSIDLAEVLNRNAVHELARLTPGDIIYVPTIAMAGTGVTGRSPLRRSTLVYVYGEVLRPGAYQYEANTNVLQAIISAGGPAPTAAMSQVRLIWQEPHSTQVACLDLESTAWEPNAPPLELQAGDTIYIPRQRSLVQALGNLFSQTYRVVLTTVASVLVYHYVR
ncbi:MAG: SLBB domain-containing protein [bacterium]